MSQQSSEEIRYHDDYRKEQKWHGRVEVLEAETKDSLFEHFYKKNNSLRYCNGCYYTFVKEEVQKEYNEWVKNLSRERSFDLYYDGGVVD